MVPATLRAAPAWVPGGCQVGHVEHRSYKLGAHLRQNMNGLRPRVREHVVHGHTCGCEKCVLSQCTSAASSEDICQINSHGKHRLEGGLVSSQCERRHMRVRLPAPRNLPRGVRSAVRGVSMLQFTRCSAPNRRGTTTCAVAVCSCVRGSRQSSLHLTIAFSSTSSGC